MNKHTIKVDKKFLPWGRFVIIYIILTFLNLLILYFLPGNVYSYIAFALLIFFVFKLLGFSSINFYIYSVIYLIIASLVVVFSSYVLSFRWLDGLSFCVLSLFILATLVYIYEHKLEKKIAFKKRRIAYFYLSLFSTFIFLFSAIFLNFIYIKVSFFNNFYTEKYFNEVDALKVNGKYIYNKMDFAVDTPGDYFIIDDFFTIEGWVVDESKIPGTKIDYVGIYLDDKPQNGGEFVSRCEYGVEREDVGEIKGDKFKDSGFFCEIDSNKIEDGLRKFYIYFHSNNFEWKYDTLQLFINNGGSFIFEDILDKKSKDIELSYSRISENGEDIILEEGEKLLKYIKLPINIKSGQDYLISFDIKKTYILNNVLNDSIHFDFFGDGYDNQEQEFNVKHIYINDNYRKINQVINTGEVPSGKNIYFRIFTYSSGSVKIENLIVYKIIRHS